VVQLRRLFGSSDHRSALTLRSRLSPSSCRSKHNRYRTSHCRRNRTEASRHRHRPTRRCRLARRDLHHNFPFARRTLTTCIPVGDREHAARSSALRLHALAIDGEGRQPGVAHITAVARRVGVNDKLVRACVDQVKAAVDRWPDLAAAAGVSRASATDIDVRLNGPRPAPRRRGAPAVGAPGRTPRRRLSR